MLDHVGLVVSDYEKSKAFYQRALAPLGYKVLMDFGQAAGFGTERPDFWLSGGEGASPSGPIHLCFAAADQATVDAFHVAALAAGGEDNGKPGIRAIYHPTYYGAFILDPDGNNIEAVHHGSPG